jgi:hypothetical protein
VEFLGLEATVARVQITGIVHNVMYDLHTLKDGELKTHTVPEHLVRSLDDAKKKRIGFL